MIDIVFCNVPYCNIDHLYNAPAILKGVVQQHGYSAKTVDFGSELFKVCGRDSKLFYKTQQYFIDPNQDQATLDIIDKFYHVVIEYFQQNPSRFIGMSLMSWQSHVATHEILKRLKSAGIKSTVVLGGRAVESACQPTYSKHIKLKDFQQNTMFGALMQQWKLADFIVYGDGEDAVLEVLQGRLPVEHAYRSESFKNAVPDYSDYEFDCFVFDNNDIVWPITGSKGCVRDCDFCDVKKLFGKYRYRSPSDIVDEMISLYHDRGARQFRFTDSLVNGGLKPFMQFLELLADFNNMHPDSKISWSGNYICRPASQLPTNYYSLLQQSGAKALKIGAESGSDEVLFHMNKKTTVGALFDELEQFRRHGIDCLLLMMFGHWSETHEDFLKHLDMLIKLTPYVKSGTVQNIRIGCPTVIFDGTPSHVNAEKNNVVIYGSTVYFCKDNHDNTLSEKIYRQLVIIKLLQQLGTISPNYLLNDLNLSYTSIFSIEQINKFYATFFEKLPSQELVESV